MKVLTDSPSNESTNSEVQLTPAATRVSDTETVVSSTLPPVRPVESDAPQLCPIPGMETQLIGHAESTNGSKKPPDHVMTGLQDTLTRGRRRDAAGMDTTVTMVTLKRRSLWRRAMRFAWRMFCCGVIDIDR